MPKLNFTCALTQPEWDIIQLAVEERYKGKPKNSISHFLYASINMRFSRNAKSPHTPCAGIKATPVQKHFEINLDDDVHESLLCFAKLLGIEPAKLVRRLFFEPELNKHFIAAEAL